MKKLSKFKTYLNKVIIVSLLLTGISCHNEKAPLPETPVKFVFTHCVNNAPVVFDTQTYHNHAGNLYELTEIQWFISDLMVDNVPLDIDKNVHYVDTNIPTSLCWSVKVKGEIQEESQLTFVFGLRGDQNTVGLFTDPPESNMIWPYPMGGDQGGYHYMKLNGFWRDLSGIRTPFNFHLGVGKVLDPITSSVSYVQNWFEVTLPFSRSQYVLDDTLRIPLIMEVNNWFQNPHIWDFNVMGGKIMDNQKAMEKGCTNGAADVFSLGSKTLFIEK